MNGEFVSGWEAVGWGILVAVVLYLAWLQVKGGGIINAASRLINRPKDGGTSSKRK